MKYFYFTMILILSFTGCSKREFEKDTLLLDNIEQIVSTYPDSAMQILDSYVPNPRDRYNYNRYLLFYVQAKNEIDKDILTNSEITDVYSYFADGKEETYAGLSAYYCGRVLLKNKEYDDAVHYFNIAETHAIRAKDVDLQGKILYSEGELMLDQFILDRAKENLIKANKLFKQTQNYKYGIKNYNNLAIAFLYNSEHDSSLYYYDKALAITNKFQDEEARAYLLKDKGVVFFDKGDYKTAIEFVTQAKKVDSCIVKSGKADLVLSNIYLKMNKIDSAKYFANSGLLEIENSTDTFNTFTLSRAYLLLSDIEEHSINYKKSLDYHKLYSKHLSEVLKEDRAAAIIHAERKYKFELAQNELAELSVKHLETQRLIFVLLLIISITTIIYYRKIIKKNRKLSDANNEIINLTDTIANFDNAKREFSNTKETIKDNLIHTFNILKRAASLEYFVQESGNKQGKILIKEFNRVAYGQETINWDILYDTINTIYDGFFDRIKVEYNNILDETELRICCLLYSKVNSNEISVIIKLRVNTIHMKCTSIRKKLGIEKYGNIVDYFNNHIK